MVERAEKTETAIESGLLQQIEAEHSLEGSVSGAGCGQQEPDQWLDDSVPFFTSTVCTIARPPLADQPELGRAGQTQRSDDDLH